ncbi:hypothetical protein E5676_scaffold258G00320 [Cucumis melo var. makuwa]|uniref:Uncharacterized protein n=3 Tax=Cucumis melo TaxID=3656 RepID=A0A5A7V9D3_CUCMM|nr:hypothetical protein [Cucumis melo subsp. melo]KAA0063834.1 hypothetical protein E6C27_scaffold827G00560 [Cucumis melo var. makuwa]TYK28218.1 hypothetical protein E5676_scaffold258G00320 [Cucumis melo var. makuwa]
MAGLQYNFFPTDLLYPKPSSSSSSSEAINRASVTFKTTLRGNKGEEDIDHGDERKSRLFSQKVADRSPLILKHQSKSTSSTF